MHSSLRLVLADSSGGTRKASVSKAVCSLRVTVHLVVMQCSSAGMHNALIPRRKHMSRAFAHGALPTHTQDKAALSLALKPAPTLVRSLQY